MKKALVLSGGGARGAYEAGVLLFLAEILKKNKRSFPFQIITGTSVGAINGCFIAASADDFYNGVRRLCEIWRSLKVEKVISSNIKGLFQYPYYEFRTRFKRFRRSKLPRKMGGLFNTRPLEELVFKAIDWRCISKNISRQVFESLAIATTDLSRGKTLVFVESSLPKEEIYFSDPLIDFTPSRITPLITLSSSAIPFLFPSVRMKNCFFADGGLRMMTPLKPAIHLGADKVFIISLKSLETPVNEDGYDSVYCSSPVRMAGKVFNSFFMDKIETDIKFATLINDILKVGGMTGGEEFFKTLKKFRKKEGKKEYRPVNLFYIRPGMDIGVIAAKYAEKLRFSLKPEKVIFSIFSRLLRYLESEKDADFLSYLLFDGEYASQLIDLGYEDAKSAEEKIEEFLL